MSAAPAVVQHCCYPQDQIRLVTHGSGHGPASLHTLRTVAAAGCVEALSKLASKAQGLADILVLAPTTCFCPVAVGPVGPACFLQW